MKFWRALPVLALLALVVVVGVFVSGKLSDHRWSGRALAEISDGGIHTDGWLDVKSELRLGTFFPIGNYVQFTFDPWRPAHAGPANVAISVCGQPEQTLAILNDAPIRISLSGCNQAVVTLRGVNPFTTVEGDSSRSVTVRVADVAVLSRVGIPIRGVFDILMASASVGVLALFAALAGGAPSSFGYLCGALAAIGYAVIVGTSDAERERFFPMWVACAALLGGMALGRLDKRSDHSLAHPSLTEKLYCWVPAVAIVILAAVLRFYGITFGLPSNFHPDEVPKVNAIMRMVDQNTLNPQYFLHPSLLLYTTYFMNTVLHALGLVDGSFRETAYLAGRIVSATAGTLSVFLTYQIGRRLLSYKAGLLGAALLAVFPLHVTCSRYLKEDALLTFCVLSCVLATVIAIQSKKPWVLLIAGLLAGVTAGTKYSGILMAGVPAAAPWAVSRRLFPEPRWIPWAMLAVLVAPLGFLLTTPYAFLDSAKFIHDFEAERRHMQTGHTQTIDAWSQLWMYHFWRSIMPGTATITAILSVVGLGFLLRRGRIEYLVIVGLVALFYMPAEFVKAKPAPQPERYIVPCLPFLALALGEFLRRLGGVKGMKLLATAAAGIVVALPLSRTLALAGEITNDTRDQMSRWMIENLPKGSTVLMDWKPYCPRFFNDEFEIVYIPRARIIPELDVRVLKESKADYLVLSSLFYNRYFSQPESNPILRQRIREVFERVPVVTQIAPEEGTYGFHNPVVTLFSLSGDDFAKLEQELVLKREGKIKETTNEVRASAKW